MNHIKSINELFGLFKKKKDDEIIKLLIDRIKLDSPPMYYNNRRRNEESENSVHRNEEKYYKFTINDLDILTYTYHSRSLSKKGGLSLSNDFYLISIDDIKLTCSKNILSKLESICDKSERIPSDTRCSDIKNRILSSNMDDSDLIKRDIKLILSK